MLLSYANNKEKMMKKINVLFVPLLVLVFVCSCATGTDISQKNPDGSPIWTKEIPKSSKYLYGVGKAKMLMDSNSQQAADAAARSDLALKINVNIKDALSVYSSEASFVVSSAYETLILQSVNLTMKKVVVEQRWMADDGTMWTLVSFRVKDLPDLYADAANDYLNQLEEKKANTQAKLVSLLADLGESDADDVLELKRLAQEKADSIVSDVVEIEGCLDVQLHVRELSKYLLDNGFEL